MRRASARRRVVDFEGRRFRREVEGFGGCFLRGSRGEVLVE